MPTEPPIVLMSWGGGGYFDWWMLVHLLGGITLAYTCRVFGVPFIPALIGVGVLMIGWEAYEQVAHIAEPWTNSVLDVILGFVGIGLAYSAIPLLDSSGGSVILAVVLLIVWGGLSFWGWLSWKARVAAGKETGVEGVVMQKDEFSQ